MLTGRFEIILRGSLEFERLGVVGARPFRRDPILREELLIPSAPDCPVPCFAFLLYRYQGYQWLYPCVFVVSPWKRREYYVGLPIHDVDSWAGRVGHFAERNAAAHGQPGPRPAAVLG